jgi:hypothetical protein
LSGFQFGGCGRQRDATGGDGAAAGRRKNKASRDIHALLLATGERGGRVDPQEFPPKLAMTTSTPTPTPMNETSDAVQLTTRPDESPKA